MEGYVSGVHRSPYHGFSIEFAEHREYVPGDDLRYLDWKVFGRTDKYYLKQFEEETNLVCHLLLDTSESMRYRSAAAALSKLEYAQGRGRRAGLLGPPSAGQRGPGHVRQRDPALVRASSNPSHLKQLLHVMEQRAAERKTATGPIFHDLAERLKKRGIVVIFSDLFDDVPRDAGRAEALPPSPPRGDRVARARSGRAGFPLPADRRSSAGWSNCPR